MLKASQITVNVSIGLESMVSSLQKKSDLLKTIVVRSVNLSNKIKKTGVVNRMKKRIQQVAVKVKNEISAKTSIDNVSLDCRNTALSWEKAFNLAENDCITRETIALTTIIQVAGRVQAEFCVNIKEENIDAELINILLTYFPIMRVKKKDWDLLIDMNELLFQKELFIELFRQDI